MLLPRILGRLPMRLRWALHNLVAHPVSGLLYRLGLRQWADLVHDITIPDLGSKAR